MIGNLADFDPAKDRVELTDDDRTSLDWWAKAKLAELIGKVDAGYRSYQFKRVVEAIFEYCNDTMSSVFMAAVKDRLYCDEATSRRRRLTQTVLYDAATSLIRMVAPVLVHTADEAWLALHGLEEEDRRCVHTEVLPDAFDLEMGAGWPAVMELRSLVLKSLEDAKQAQGIKNTLDAGIEVTLPADEAAVIEPFGDELADLFGVSRCTMAVGGETSVTVVDLREEPRCERSWKRDGTVRERSDGGMLSDRDAAAVGVS